MQPRVETTETVGEAKAWSCSSVGGSNEEMQIVSSVGCSPGRPPSRSPDSKRVLPGASFSPDIVIEFAGLEDGP